MALKNKPRKIDFGFDGSDVDAASGVAGYKGELPPKGTYAGVLKRLQLGKSGPTAKTPGAPLLRILVEIKEPKGTPQAKYNGYGAWGNLNVTEQGAPWVNGFLQAIAGPNEMQQKKLVKAFWNGGMVVDADDHVTKIGTFKVNSPNAEIPVAFNGQHDTYKDETSLKPRSYLVMETEPSEDDDEDELDYDEEEAEEYEADEEDEDEEEEEEDEDEDDGDEEDEDDADEPEDDDPEDDDAEGEDGDGDDEEEEEEEPEPVKPARKRAAAKRPAAKAGREMF